MMNWKRANRTLAPLLVCAALLATACKSEPSGPTIQPGQLTVSASTTGSAGAAFLVTVRGANISNPVAGGSGLLLYPFLSGDTLKAAVVGSLSSGALLKFSVPDVNQASSYKVTINQVAGSDNALLPSGAWTATIE